MSSSFSEPAEFPWAVAFTGEEGFYSDGLCTNPPPLCAPTDDSTLEATIGEEQATTWTAFHYGEEAFLLPHIHHPHAKAESFLVCVQPEFGPRPNLLTYEVSASTFP